MQIQTPDLAPQRPDRYHDLMAEEHRARLVPLSGEDRRAALIAAALFCIAEGGIKTCTLNRIGARARLLHGLITRHFGSRNALATTGHARIHTTSPPPQTDLVALLDRLFAPALFNRDCLSIGFTLWAEISKKPDLRAEHRAQNANNFARITTAPTTAVPDLQGTPALAHAPTCLVGGLRLQHWIDPASLPATLSRQSCIDLLTPTPDR